ncbi:Uncharacterised protein g4914 [Pycnogonum litorale]
MLASFISGIRAKFSSINHLDTDVLQNWIGDSTLTSSKNDLVNWQRNDDGDNSGCTIQMCLFDNRSIEEYEVSHLQSAVFTPPDISDDKLRKLLKQTVENDSSAVHIVCYCSVGYRSSVMVQRINKLRQDDQESLQKIRETYNLHGSIFKWANENRSLVDKYEKSTKYVHPYNWVFGKMLNADRRWNY